MDTVVEFAKEYNNQMNAIMVFSENELSSNACQEAFNLALITGKLGKTSSGIISLKEKNNSQGLFDMGVCMKLGVGGAPIDDVKLISRMKQAWKVSELPVEINPSLYKDLEDGKLKNLFIFGEDPLGCAIHKVQVAGWLSVSEFRIVQDYFMTETAKLADLVLPASLPVESGGSFTNTQRVLQEFEAELESKVERSGWQQLRDILEFMGSEEKADVREVLQEALSLLPSEAEDKKFRLSFSKTDNDNRYYYHGCDYLMKRFDKEFENAFIQSR
jgi:formate dehydrogenase major subunit